MVETERLYKFAVAYVSRRFSNGGRLLSRVYMHYGGNKVATMDYTHKNNGMQKQLRNMARTTVWDSRKRRELDGVVVLGEAWLHHPKHAAICDVLRPSLDPDRIEVVCVAVWGSEGRKVGIFEIENGGGKRRVGSQIEAPCNDVTSWLESAFQSEAGRRVV